MKSFGNADLGAALVAQCSVVAATFFVLAAVLLSAL
jgi:hypothetical protein